MREVYKLLIVASEEDGFTDLTTSKVVAKDMV